MDPRYLDVISKYYPGVSSVNLREYTAGWDYFVCTVDDQMAFRFPRREEYARQLPNELAFLHEFAPICPVTVPQASLDHLADGTPFAVYPFIPGKMFTPELAATFYASELEGIAIQVAGFLSALHEFSVERVGQLGFPTVDVLAAHEERTRKTKELVFPLLSASERDWLSGRLNSYRQLVTNHPPELTPTHTDLLPEHMIIDVNTHRLNGVIDYGDLEVFDPAADFTFLSQYGEEFLDTAYEHYHRTRDDFFEERRLFYEDYLYVLGLKHSVEKANTAGIPVYREELSKHILAAQTRS